MVEPEYLTPKQVAALLGVQPASVRRWIRDGRLRALKLGTGRSAHKRVLPEDLEAFLALNGEGS